MTNSFRSSIARVLVGAIVGFFLGMAFGTITGALGTEFAVAFAVRSFTVTEAMLAGAAIGFTVGALSGWIAAATVRSVIGKRVATIRTTIAGGVIGLVAGTLGQGLMWALGQPPIYMLSTAFAGTSAGAIAGIVYGVFIGSRAQEEPVEPESAERKKQWAEFVRTKLPDSDLAKSVASLGSWEEQPLSESAMSWPPIASFMRRLVAWVLDVILLGIIGQMIGFAFSGALLQLGPYGRLIGVVLIGSYFGILNSCLGGGQTLGKRFTQIAVRDAAGRPIGVGRSLLRITILASPAILRGWTLPILQVGVLTWLQAVVLFGFGIVLLYTMVFNRKTRQGLHDLICRTYVVHLSGRPVGVILRTPRVHWAVSAALFTLVTLAISLSFLSSWLAGGNQESSILHKVSQALQTDSRFFSSSVSMTRVYSYGSKQTRILQVNVWYKGNLPAREEAGNLSISVAKTILATGENIDEFDMLRITITSGYDIGVATGYMATVDSQEPDVWRRRVGFAESSK